MGRKAPGQAGPPRQDAACRRRVVRAPRSRVGGDPAGSRRCRCEPDLPRKFRTLGGQRLLLGSTAENVVRRSSRRVLVTRRRALGRVRRILVPVDFDDASMDALRFAREAFPRKRRLKPSTCCRLRRQCPSYRRSPWTEFASSVSCGSSPLRRSPTWPGMRRRRSVRITGFKCRILRRC